MIIALTIIFTLLMVGFIFLTQKADKKGQCGLTILGIAGGVITGGILIIMVIALAENINNVISEKTIDNKIVMYEEENIKIETQITVLVEQYIDYETETLTELKGNEMALVSLYPELKADTLVQEQIKVYTRNNDKIKELKEKKIDIKLSKWWLYFG